MALPGRVTELEVKAIITVLRTAVLTPYIDFANELVTEVCASKFLADGVTLYYSTYRLKMIELWLSAHAYTIYDPRASSEKVSVITQRLQGKIDLGLDSSLYGQNAMRLDTLGGLAALNNAQKKKQSALAGGVYWAGTGSYEDSVTEDIEELP